ncbi:MAG: sensor histidine kinase [Solirubrobacteraceae bacterium]|nr:sensor histidine kinase [Solirubrobacteraceae bacterium]
MTPVAARRTVPEEMVGDRQPWRHDIPPRAVDAALAAAVAAAMVLTVSVAEEAEATRAPDQLAYLLGIAVGALLLARRRFPIGVLIGSVGALFAYYGLDYPAFSPAVALTVAAYTAVVAGHRIATALLLAGIMLFGVGWQTLAEDTDLASVIGTNTLADVALLTAVVLLGEAIRNRRAWTDEVRLRLQRAEEDRARETARRIEQERLRIARELHDVLAHTITAIGVQARVAADVVGESPLQAEGALRAIRDHSSQAIAELRATVGVLREDDSDAPRAPEPGLAQLGVLTDMAVRAGVQVEVDVAGRTRTLPAAVDLTAYRIVQESLTNVVRHARARSATVTLRYERDALTVLVQDDGRGLDGAAQVTGHGLIGMRERAAAFGGTLQAGPAASGGFRVVARIPLPEATA